MIDIQKNHTILISDLAMPDFDIKDKYVIDTGITKLEYGWNVILLYSWLTQKMYLKSKDLMSKGRLTEKMASEIRDLAVADCVEHPIKNGAIYGGNILLPNKPTFSLKDMKAAISLFNGNKLTKTLQKTLNSKFSANILEYQDLSSIISLIDFPIPSVAILLQTLGYYFIIKNPYISEGIILGQASDDYTQLFVFYDDMYYKFMSMPVFMRLASQDLLKEPLSKFQVIDLEILTNHIAEE